MQINKITLQGKLVKLMYREGMSKNGKEFLSATFTLDVDGNRINAETFTMKMKGDNSEESGAYKSLMTLWNEAKALQKSYKAVGEEKAVDIENETIVENIEEATAVKMSNYGSFKYCKFSENSFTNTSGEQIKNTRISFAYPNRMKDEDYVAKRDFEICGKIKTAPVLLEKTDGTEYMKFTVIVPEYIEQWNDRPEQVKLQEITVTSHDPQAFGYIEDNFTMGSFVYLNGEIVRTVSRVEKETVVDDSRGFGRHLKSEPEYKTEVDERFEIMGGYELNEDELEMEKAFSQELWEKAEQEQEQEKPVEVNKSFGRSTTQSTPKKNNALPF